MGKQAYPLSISPLLGGESRLLLITNDYPPDTGGVAWYYANLAALRQAQGDKIDVLKLGKWTMTPLWPLMVIPIILRSVRAIHESPLPFYWWVGQVLPVGTVVWLLSFVWRKPYIVSTHGMDILLPLKSGRKRWLVGKILERASLITTNSQWTKRKIIENYTKYPSPAASTVIPAEAGIQIKQKKRFSFFSGSPIRSGMTSERGLSDKIIVIYPEPKPKRNMPQEEVNALRLKLGIPESAKVLLTVSRLVKRKGIDRVLAALPEAWKRIPDVHYMVVGDGDERSQLSVISYQLSGGDKVHFVGKVSDKELPVYYAMADAFILLPREVNGDAEGFGIVYLEANQYGLPIIATKSGGTEEALEMCQRVTVINNPDHAKDVAQALWEQFR